MCDKLGYHTQSWSSSSIAHMILLLSTRKVPTVAAVRPTSKSFHQRASDTFIEYRSGIFYVDEKQHETAVKVTDEIRTKHPLVKQAGKVATEISPADKSRWWKAEDYHQM